MVHCYYCLYITFSANPVRRSEDLKATSTHRIILHIMKFSILSIASFVKTRSVQNWVHSR